MNASYFPQLKHKKNNLQSLQNSLTQISVLNKRNHEIQEILQNQVSRARGLKFANFPQQSPKLLEDSCQDQKIFHYYSRMKLVGKKFTQQNKINDYQTDTTSRNDEMSGSRNTFSPYHQDITKITENTSKSMNSLYLSSKNNEQRSAYFKTIKRTRRESQDDKKPRQQVVFKQFKFLLPQTQQKKSIISPMREYLQLDGKKGSNLGSSSTLQFASNLMDKIANNLKQTSESFQQVGENKNQFNLKTSVLVSPQIKELNNRAYTTHGLLNTQQKIVLRKSTRRDPQVATTQKILHKQSLAKLQRYTKTSIVRNISPPSHVHIDSRDYGNTGDIRGWETYVLEDTDGEQFFNTWIK